MEKKGDVFNQLAIIADLLENVNLEVTDANVIFVLKQPEFDRMFDKIVAKTKVVTPEMLQTSFSMKVGSIDFVFTLDKD